MSWYRAGSAVSSACRPTSTVRHAGATMLGYKASPLAVTSARLQPSVSSSWQLLSGRFYSGPVSTGQATTRRSMATVVATQPSREEIVKSIKGQALRLPNLENLFEGWPREVNPHEHLVKEVVDKVLEQYTVSSTVLVKLTKGNLGRLLAVWYPFASPERLTELAYFVCWMFILDDEIDTITSTSTGQVDHENNFFHIWDETLRVITESCSLNGEADTGKNWRPSDFDSVESFRGIGQLLTQRYTVDQRRRFWEEIERTANSYRREQRIRKGRGIPDYDAYCDYRYGSCCMAQVISMVEYANESNIPNEIMESPEMKALWEETTKLLWVNNDIVSIKKEIADDFLENLVVIAAKPNYRLQDGLDHCVEKLRHATVQLDKAASILKAKYVDGQTGGVAREVDRFILNCRSLAFGTFLWSKASPRYGLLDEPRDGDDCITFVVGEAPL